EIQNVADLEAAARAGSIARLKGFGPRMQEKLLDSIRLMRETKGAMHAHTAQARVLAACERLHAAAPEIQFYPAGEVRRGNAIVRSLAVVGRAADITGVVHNEIAGVELTVSDVERFGVAMLQATGPEEHIRRLAELAGQRGLSLLPDGLYRSD